MLGSVELGLRRDFLVRVHDLLKLLLELHCLVFEHHRRLRVGVDGGDRDAHAGVLDLPVRQDAGLRIIHEGVQHERGHGHVDERVQNLRPLLEDGQAANGSRVLRLRLLVRHLHPN